uniref:Uncharacterized protein n=1 Tax=Romanomermis culicivorax TaxID=13658 RepID=A0A915HIP5_ROMCU
MATQICKWKGVVKALFPLMVNDATENNQREAKNCCQEQERQINSLETILPYPKVSNLKSYDELPTRMIPWINSKTTFLLLVPLRETRDISIA